MDAECEKTSHGVDCLRPIGSRFVTEPRGRLLAALARELARDPLRPTAWFLLGGLLVPRRWGYPLLRRLAGRIFIPGMSPSWAFRDGRRTAELPADVVAIVVSTGESTLQACVEALENQSMRPRIRHVRNVAPISEAYNRVLDLADGEFHCVVDADMILHRHALRTLVRALRENAAAGSAIAFLQDEFLGRIGHVRMYRTAATRGLRYRDVLRCDMEFRRRVAARGYSHVQVNRTLGIHVSIQDPLTTYHAFLRRGQKCALVRPREARRQLRTIVRAASRRADSISLLALAAFCWGLVSRSEGEKDFRTYDTAEARRAVRTIMGDEREAPRDASEG